MKDDKEATDVAMDSFADMNTQPRAWCNECGILKAEIEKLTVLTERLIYIVHSLDKECNGISDELSNMIDITLDSPEYKALQERNK